MRLIAARRFLPLSLCITLLLVTAPNAHAIDLPATGTAAFIQTTGPDSPLSTGDYYTNSNGGNNSTGHDLQIVVPCAWPAARSITFTLFDPEVAEADPSNGILADDEILDDANQETVDNLAASDTSFVLTAPGGASINKTFTPTGGTNGFWTELVTLTPNQLGYGCGVYRMSTQSVSRVATPTTQRNNDDNAWALRVAHDPDCTASTNASGTCSPIGAATSALLDNGNHDDNPDGLSGSGDEPSIGMQRTSFQQYPRPAGNNAALSCQRFYTFVELVPGTVTFSNFDLDNSINTNVTVTYIPPEGSSYGSTIVGTASANAQWNNPPTPPIDKANRPLRGGDTYTIGTSDVGWWAIQICVPFPNPPAAFKNQYVVESSAGLLYLNQPPLPRLALSKTDNIDLVSAGQQLTYVLSFANTANTTATPGTATDVRLSDPLPPGTSYQSCSIDLPYTGTCALAGTQVIFQLDQPVLPGATGSVRVSVNVAPNPPATLENVAQLTFRDTFGNQFPPLTAIDRDTTRAPSAVTLSAFTATGSVGTVVLNWQTSAEIDTYGFYIRRSSSGGPENAVRISPLVVATGAGSRYRWSDTSPDMSATYWLEEREVNGSSTLYGPVKVAAIAQATFRAMLPLVGR